MRASTSAKKVPGGDAPIAKRCAFVGHLMNAENTAAVIELLASIEADCAGVSAGTIRKECPDQMRLPPPSAYCGPRLCFRCASAPTGRPAPAHVSAPRSRY